MLTLIWFLFGMNSYVIFLQNLFAKLTLQWFLFDMGSYKCGTPSVCVKCLYGNAHTDEVSFWNVIFNALKPQLVNEINILFRILRGMY